MGRHRKSVLQVQVKEDLREKRTAMSLIVGFFEILAVVDLEGLSSDFERQPFPIKEVESVTLLVNQNVLNVHVLGVCVEGGGSPRIILILTDAESRETIRSNSESLCHYVIVLVDLDKFHGIEYAGDGKSHMRVIRHDGSAGG